MTYAPARHQSTGCSQPSEFGLADNVDAVDGEQAQSLLGIVEAENNQRPVAALLDEGVHVFHVQVLLGQDLEDVGEPAGLVADLDGDEWELRDEWIDPTPEKPYVAPDVPRQRIIKAQPRLQGAA